jgi:hypothetical protein
MHTKYKTTNHSFLSSSAEIFVETNLKYKTINLSFLRGAAHRNICRNESEIQNNQSFPEQQRCEIFVETNLNQRMKRCRAP